MRERASNNGIRLKAYAGTTGVLLAMDVTPAKRQGLLGFAIERDGGRGHRWLPGLIRFPGQGGERLTPVESREAPFQKFRWSDYGVYPDSAYSYRVHGVYGSPGHLRLVAGGEVSLRTEPLDRGRHQVIFNRAAAASQAYSARFGSTNPDNEEDPQSAAARAWLSRGLLEKLLGFLGGAGPGEALDVAIYEIELDEVVAALAAALARGVRVRVVYHAKPGDEQTQVNEEKLEALPAEVKVGRVTSSIFHQKFVVRSRILADGRREPRAVLTGSTNFTPNGVYRQANVVHVVDDQDLAAEYLGLFEKLFEGASTGDTKRFIDGRDAVLPDAPMQAVFSPRSRLTDLEEVRRLLLGARSDVIFCTAFTLHQLVTSALLPEQEDDVIRYGLQNTRSTITGYHRRGRFVAKAFLKGGLEGFLKESTAGQRGNILIHLKAILCDFTGDDPVVLTGSNNFSTNASSKNDENLLIVRGEPAVADVYACEMLRMYDHYRFRFNQESRAGRGPRERLTLRPDDGWTDRYFEDGSLLALERVRFASS